jgi:hypothetical protein
MCSAEGSGNDERVDLFGQGDRWIQEREGRHRGRATILTPHSQEATEASAVFTGVSRPFIPARHHVTLSFVA